MAVRSRWHLRPSIPPRTHVCGRTLGGGRSSRTSVSSRWERTKVTTRGGREWPRRIVLRVGCGSVGEKAGAGGACGLSPWCSWVVLDTGELRGPLCLLGFALKACMAYSNQR